MKRAMIIIIGIILFIWSVIPLVITGNFKNIGTLTCLGISVLLIVYGISMHSVNRFLVNAWHTAAGKIIEIILLVICAGIIALAVATGVSMISAASSAAEPGSTVVVLGARVYKDRVSTALKTRLDAAIKFLNENPDSMCIVSGGQGQNEPCTESSVMYDYLVARGIDPARIYTEDKSTDTEENIRFSGKIIESEGLNPVIGIATDGYHEYRAIKNAEKAGFKARAIPAGTVWWLAPTSIVREMYGILEQWFLK